MIPPRQIRAVFDETSIVVYQAYSPHIAEPALRAQTFVSPFKMTRMTWIKPSFLWMMYRCGWACKEGQERVLRIRMTRSGFEVALSSGCLSSAAKQGVPVADWPAYKARYPVRVQWDPERDLAFTPLVHRSIQMGLSGSAVQRFVHDWIVGIDDVTELANRVGALVRAGRLEEASALVPTEKPYPSVEPWQSRLRVST